MYIFCKFCLIITNYNQRVPSFDVDCDVIVSQTGFRKSLCKKQLTISSTLLLLSKSICKQWTFQSVNNIVDA